MIPPAVRNRCAPSGVCGSAATVAKVIYIRRSTKMSGAWLPIWIIGAPFIGILVLSAIFKGGSSASTSVDRGPTYSR
jgi:hypothetical protein